MRSSLDPSLVHQSGSGLQDYIDQDEERDGKQQEIVEKTNTRRLRVYYLYTMPHM